MLMVVQILNEHAARLREAEQRYAQLTVALEQVHGRVSEYVRACTPAEEGGVSK